MIEIFSLPFMQRAMIAAVLSGLIAPAIGTFIVQKRMSLLGDGLGHVAIMGVGLAMLTGWAPLPVAVVVCVTGAVAEVPARFLEWLAPNGRLFVIHGQSPVMEATLWQGGVNAARPESLFETDIPYLVGGEPTPRFVL